MSTRLFVRNIPFTMTERELRDLFVGYDCMDVEIVREDLTRNSRGFAFVSVEDKKAITDLNGQEVNGRCLSVQEARPETRRQARRRSRDSRF